MTDRPPHDPDAPDDLYDQEADLPYDELEQDEYEYDEYDEYEDDDRSAGGAHYVDVRRESSRGDAS